MVRLLRHTLFGWAIGFGATFGILYAIVTFLVFIDWLDRNERRDWYVKDERMSDSTLGPERIVI